MDAGWPDDRPRGPRRVLGSTRPWPLFDVRSSRAIEASELGRHPPGVLMARAGCSVARVAMAVWPFARSVWVAAGPGGNGGDGLHAAAELARRGRQVHVTLLAATASLADDARIGLERARAAGVHVDAQWPDQPADLHIDALLGLGGTRAAEGRLADAIERLNRAGAPCLAIDLPSGLSADTGERLGTAVVQASVTLALLTLKPGLFTGAGREVAGDIWIDPLGAAWPPLEHATARLSARDDLVQGTRAARHADHKGSHGDVFVIGGAAGMHGAARLAAAGALGAGAGRTVVSLLDRTVPAGDMTRPEWLWCDGAWLPGRADLEHATVVCGCGGGEAVAAALPAVLARAARLVLDADALNAIARDPALAELLDHRAARGLATVMTPHPLEAARLLATTTAVVQADRLGAARKLADRHGAIVILKGSGSVIAAPGRPCVVNASGSGRLATGGTGDVLAGWIAGAWSRTASADNAASAFDTAFDTAVAAVWCHGEAAAAGEGPAVRARELVDGMRRCLAGPQA